MADIVALQETLEYIEAHPEGHSQDAWGVRDSCGTFACFAGWHLLLTGQAEFVTYDFQGDVEHLEPLIKGLNCFQAAQRSLDLTYRQAHAIFVIAGDLDTLRTIIERIEAGEAPLGMDHI